MGSTKDTKIQLFHKPLNIIGLNGIFSTVNKENKLIKFSDIFKSLNKYNFDAELCTEYSEYSEYSE
jgi:hypothetical protein